MDKVVLDLGYGGGLGALLIALTSLLAYEILRATWLWLPRLTVHSRLKTLLLLAPIFLCHMLAIWLYALTIYFVSHHTSLGSLKGESLMVSFAPSFMECLHYSTVVYTTVGFGDVVPTGILQMLAGAEALNGLVMIGWSVSLSYLAMERFWDRPGKSGG